MPKNKQQAYDEILEYMNDPSRKYPQYQWCCGVTETIERLIKKHNLLKGYECCPIQCESNQIAREVEKDLIDLGCSGDTGVGNSSSDYVYVYLKNELTTPPE